MIGAEAEFAARLEFGGDQIERSVVHHPSLGMARLGPGIRVQQIDERQRPVGHAAQHLQRVAVMQADIRQGRVRTIIARDVNERLGDAVEERLGADEAVVGQHVGPLGEMLAAAEADLEMQRRRVAEQPLGGDRPFLRHAHLRQQMLDQILLPLAQGPPLAAAVEPVECRRIAGFVRGHAPPARAETTRLSSLGDRELTRLGGSGRTKPDQGRRARKEKGSR